MPHTAFRSRAVASPLAVRFGPDDPDTVHAIALRAVQDSMKRYIDWQHQQPSDGIAAGPGEWRVTAINGIEDDLRRAYLDAVQAGVPISQIDTAHDLGRAGVGWDQQPAHRLLGRLERLAHELTLAEAHRGTDRTRIRDLEHELDRAQTRNADLTEDLAHARNTILRQTEEIVDAEWLTGNRHHNIVPGPQPARALAQTNAELALANDIDALDRAASTDTSSGIGAAIDTALPGRPDYWPDTTDPDTGQAPGTSDHGPEVTP
ncbi:hypothetical protein A5780_09430 [Nocardia sp. 852002-20019_SCH5090214]|uniref:hypothetical protein n=1 Tax=Nocardia sp. 852002-20019_SCH5090214 TaxID=1834087 RepID=UPI0007EC2A66|nr:hypothetical protein [Nocardia sp. 852002-20019_SCH5090214]OBA67927.1 hypothetical protein A5780_09430 [Nocardia sp. 852002-20019_SCH5090214]